MILGADKIVQNILHLVCVICKSHRVFLSGGTSISKERISCIFRAHLSTHVRRFLSVICHHSGVTPSVEKLSFTFQNTIRYVLPDLTIKNPPFCPQRAICVDCDSVCSRKTVLIVLYSSV